MATFRKVEMYISKGNGHGSYILQADYKGQNITAEITDSEVFDWLKDDTNKVKHQEAKRKAYEAIRTAYKVLRQGR